MDASYVETGFSGMNFHSDAYMKQLLMKDASYLEHCKNVLRTNGYTVFRCSEYQQLLELLRPPDA